MWAFVILACLGSDCTDVRSLAIYETRAECVEAAGHYIAHTLQDYRVSMVECFEGAEA